MQSFGGLWKHTERIHRYQEMITNLGMMSHPNPRNILVIGGGDGGVLREVVKHDCVEKADLCDIDEAVPRLSKKYLPHMAQGLEHRKVTVVIGDGLEFVKKEASKNHYDLIITDSSDPEGPARKLFEKEYFEDCYNALREGGVITTQGCSSDYPHLLTSVASLMDSTNMIRR